MLGQERLDLLLGRARLADQLLTQPQHLTIGLLLLCGNPYGPQQPLLSQHGQPTAIEPIALGLGADGDQQLRGGDYLRLVALGLEPACQGEAGGAGFVDHLGDAVPDRLESLEEDLGAGRLNPSGDHAALVADESDVVGALVDIDAHVNRLAAIEANRVGRCLDDGERSRLLGGRHGRHLRRKTCESATQVCHPNGYPAYMLSSGCTN
jgi:hypothetical protein